MRMQEKETDDSRVQSGAVMDVELRMARERKAKETGMNARGTRLCRVVNKSPLENITTGRIIVRLVGAASPRAINPSRASLIMSTKDVRKVKLIIWLPGEEKDTLLTCLNLTEVT